MFPTIGSNKTLFTGGHKWASSLQSLPANAIPIHHSFGVHSCIHSILPGSRHCRGRATQNESFFFSSGPTPGPEGRVAGVFRCIAPAGQHAPAGPIVHAPEQLHRHASPSFLPQVQSSRSPPASDPELGVHACAERLGGSGRGVGIPEPGAEMHRHHAGRIATRAETRHHPRLCSRPGCTLRARSRGLTDRGSLAGPGPKLTTCLGASMVRGYGRQLNRRQPNAWSSASLSATPTLCLLPTLSRRPHWPALSQTLR